MEADRHPSGCAVKAAWRLELIEESDELESASTTAHERPLPVLSRIGPAGDDLLAQETDPKSAGSAVCVTSIIPLRRDDIALQTRIKQEVGTGG